MTKRKRNDWSIVGKAWKADHGAFEFPAFKDWIEAHWKAIDLAVTREIDFAAGDELPDPHVSALDDVNPATGHFGAGYWGVAYPTAYPRWALKITCDPMEGPVAQFIIDNDELHDHAGVARFLKVWRGTAVKLGRAKPLQVYVIVRENIMPVSLTELPTGSRKMFNQLDDVADDVLDVLVDPDSDQEEQDEALEEWSEFLRSMARVPELHNVAKFMALTARLGPIIMSDVRAPNLGWRQFRFGDFSPHQDRRGIANAVLHDVGHSSHGLGRVGVHRLPRLERNPGIPVLGKEAR